MKQIYLVLLACLVSLAGYSQTAASYNFSRSTGTYSSISGLEGTHTAVSVHGDDVTQQDIPIGFNFTFCGTTYSELSACSNGWLSLANVDDNILIGGPVYVPGAGFLFPFWFDQYVGSGEALYRTSGTSPNRVFTFEWYNWSRCCDDEGYDFNFQVKLYEGTNTIQFCYGTHLTSEEAANAIGIANSSIDYQVLPSLDATATINSGWTDWPDVTVGFVTKPAAGTILTWSLGCSPISGESTICAGTATTYSNAETGGTWSSSNTSVATVGSSGLVNGVAAGSATITYAHDTCFVTQVINVTAGPSSITIGSPVICAGSSTTAASATAGGTWASDNASVATVGESTGIVSGIDAGTATIIYTIGSCSVSTIVSVSAAPVITSSPALLCAGSTFTATASVPGGAWSSSNTSKAIVNVATGVITGVSAGTARISYSLSAGCYASEVATVTTTPSAISGTLALCMGSTSALASATSGGTWSSADPDVATVSASTGVVTAVAEGTATIIYTLGSCSVSAIATVNAALAANTGELVVCVGQSVSLSNAASGGTWSSSDAAVATAGAGTGLVTGVTAGTASITYTAGPGCYSVSGMTVNASVGTITGSLGFCIGGTSSLSNSGSGSWSSSNPSKATIDAGTGIVTGIEAGTTVISFTVSAGCFTTAVATVNSVPSALIGSTSVCVGSSITLSSAPGGGTWSSSASVATVSASGVVTGIAAGTSVISYTLGTGCSAAREVAILDLPTSLIGSLATCVGSTTALSSSPSGGIWSSNTTSVATVGSASGIVTGMAAGTSRITYTTSSGCFTTEIITVATTPASITGSLALCEGSTSSLSSATTGGDWSSADEAVATINSVTGVATAVGTGTATISYSIGACSRTAVLSVGAGVPANTGGTSVCVGQATVLSNAATGGTWSSSDAGRATVNAGTGVVTGVSAGTVYITYHVSGGCFAVTEVAVSNAVPAITGTLSVCPGGATTLSGGTGGSWSSSNTSKATIDAATGVLTGIAAGTTTISYIVSAGCYAIATATVSSSPATINGNAGICLGSTTTLTCATGGGTWSSSAGAIASASGTTGSVVVSGISMGNATISYIVASGCAATRHVTVNELPGSIGGSLAVCVGSTSALSATPGGGTWASAFTSRATINATTGVMTGVSVGTTRITYTVAGGCRSIEVATVNALPAAINISGSAFLCVAGTRTCTSTTTGGTWTSSDLAVATINPATGVLAGVGAGTTTISYTNAAGCSATRSVTVNVSGGSISGDNVVCVGQTNATLTTGLSGGTWASSASAIANVHASNGLLTGVSVGTANVTYTQSPGCYIFRTVSVNAAVSNIVGPVTTIVGNTVTLTNATPGGTWSSSNITKATIVAGTGELTGVATGTTSITYFVSTGCYRLRTQTMTLTRPGSIAGSVSGVLAAYPNPTNGTLNIQAPVNGMFSVYTVDGRFVKQYMVTTEPIEISLPGNLAAGVYMCRFTGDDGTIEVLRLVYQQ